MPTLQSNYTQYHDGAQLGMIADSRYKAVRSMTYEGATALGFGLALTFGANDNGADLGGTVFAGIVVSQKVLDPVNNATAYVQYDTVGLMTQGSIWVEASVAVAAGDPVHFDAATGVISNTGGVQITDAVFETSAQAGDLARVYMQ